MFESRRIRTLLAGALAMVALSCGSDESDPNGPGPGGVGETVTIGASGGSVEATLDDGSAISLSIPAGALNEAIDVTLEPGPIGAGQLTAFTLSPAGVRLAHPATLVVQLDDASSLTPNSVVVFEQNGLRIPVNTTLNLGAGSLTVSMDRLGIASDAAVAAPAGPAASRVFRASGAGGSGSVQNMNSSQLAQAALAALDSFIVKGTLPSAGAMLFAMDAFFGLTASPQNDPLFNTLVSGWRVNLCTFQDFAISVMNSYNFSSDFANLERVLGDVIGWAIESNRMAASLATVGEPGCSGTAANPEPDIEAKLATLTPAIETDLNGYALLPSPRDSSFHTDRLRPLLNVATLLALAGYVDATNAVTALLPAQAIRLRDAGYADCLAGNKQSVQGRLIRLEALASVFAAVSAYTVRDLEDDIEMCGMQPAFVVEDARAAQLAGGFMGGGNQPGVIVPAQAATVSGEGILRFTGTLNALRCPAGLSTNNEQLQVQAGRPTSSLQPVATISPSNSDRYLEFSPLEVPLSDIRNAAGFGTLDTGTVQVVLTRIGGACGGQFATLAHSPIGTINFLFLGPSMSDSWEGTLVTTGGNASTIPVVVNIQQTGTSASGPYLVMNSHIGPAGLFQATYDGIRLSDVVMGTDSMCTGGGFTAASLFVTATTISGTLTGTNCVTQGTAELSLTRRNATVLNGPWSGVWSGEITVNGVGPNLVITRFIQADDKVDGSWGGGSGLGHFSGTLSGNTFGFTGSDDAPTCRLSTAGSIIMVATDSLTFTGSAGNCNGGFTATGFVKPGLP